MFIGGSVGFMGTSGSIRGVTFDGTNDYMVRGGDLTGNADGKVGTLSFWFKNGTDGSSDVIWETDGRFYIQKTPDDSIDIQLYTSAPGSAVLLTSNNDTVEISDGWTHVLASWDAANNKAHLYLNDAVNELSKTINNLTIDYTRTNHSLGDGLTGGSRMAGDLAAFYLNTAAYIDITVEANRRKFITAAGYPASLGADGSTPTGTAPIVFLHLADGAAVSTFATNKGTGGGFTLTGTLTEATTSPKAGAA